MADSFPIGGIIAFIGAPVVAGTNLPSNGVWMLCDGSALSSSLYQPLFNCIKYAHGGDSAIATFNLPDCRGRFLRGVSNGAANRDLEAAQRTAAKAGGNSGDAVGSIQDWATEKPKSPFIASLPNLPTAHAQNAWSPLGTVQVAHWNDADTQTQVTQGGDKETRPINIAVDFYIKYADSDQDVPVGTVVAYAGEGYASLEQLGWMLCDGRAIAIADASDLYSAIGIANGAPDRLSFNIPDCQGMFLRGVDHGIHVDVDADVRQYARENGNTGDAIGSIQHYATALPRKAFSAAVPNAPVEMCHANDGSRIGPYMALWNSDAVAMHVTGGDTESRPINSYVHFIIKHAPNNQDNSSVAIPPGAVIAFAGVDAGNMADTWLLCDGKECAGNEQPYTTLFRAISTHHGGDGDPYFNIPDYQGYFLRGVANSSNNDPDRMQRIAPFPDRDPNKQGASGDMVGSVQASATGIPLQSAFIVSVSHLPTEKHRIDSIPGYDNALWSDASPTMTLAQAGGDAESRPVNLSIQWYIKMG